MPLIAVEFQLFAPENEPKQDNIPKIEKYLHWLETQFEIPKGWVSPRFGIREFHHPELMEALDELSPAFALLELIDQLEPWGKASNEWEGTATELRQLLIADDRTNVIPCYLGNTPS